MGFSEVPLGDSRTSLPLLYGDVLSRQDLADRHSPCTEDAAKIVRKNLAATTARVAAEYRLRPAALLD